MGKKKASTIVKFRCERDTLVEALEAALVSAARKKYGNRVELEAQYSDETGEVEVFELGEIRIIHPFVVTIGGAEHARPWVLNADIACLAGTFWQRIAFIVENGSSNPSRVHENVP